MRLNLACGSTRWPGFDNSDIHGEPGSRYVDLLRPLPYLDGCCDIVMISHGLAHTITAYPVIPDLHWLFSEVHRVLEPGGWFRIDDNPSRIYTAGEAIDVGEAAQEATRGYPPDLRLPRQELVDMLLDVGFSEVHEINPNSTLIDCDSQTRVAIVGNHLGHYSFTIEARK